MAKATELDIAAAGDAMSVLQDISMGYYPSREGDGEEDPPNHFDPDNFDHLRKFYDLMNATLNKSAGWPGRVIGGMCYVIMFDENNIIDPASDTLDLHPHFAATAKQRDDLLEVAKKLKLARVRFADETRTDIDLLDEALDMAITATEGGAA